MLAAAAAPVMTGVPANILVVGGGLTGAAVSRALRRRLPETNVEVWEALDAAGGRFHTEHTVLESGAEAYADTGAQYVTVTDDKMVAAAHLPLVTELTRAGVLEPLSGKIVGGRAADGGGNNYVAPCGLSSIVKHVFESVGIEPCYSRRALALRRVGRRWEVQPDGVTSEGPHNLLFDGVVLTQPIPQQLTLLGAGDGEGGEWLDAATFKGVSRADLQAVQYSRRYALTLLFPPSQAAHFKESIDWIARYVDKKEDDALVYVAYDRAKRRGLEAVSDEAISLVAHTSVPYGLRTMGAGTPEADVVSDLTTRVQRLLPWLPAPERTLLRAWPISQVRTPLELPEGVASLLIQPFSSSARTERAPPLILCGDAFSPLGSRFDGCVQSGEHAAAEMQHALV